jgi:tetratricopeptide (TPR) repeat protein
MALGVDEKLASAHNGLANLYLLQGDYDRAIEAGQKAVALESSYLFAYFDLAMAHFGKAQRAKTKQEFIEAAVGFQQAVEQVIALSEAGAGALPPSAEEDLVRKGEWMTQKSKWMAGKSATE